MRAVQVFVHFVRQLTHILYVKLPPPAQISCFDGLANGDLV